MTTTNRGIAWAAGLYEGEGSLCMSSRGYPKISLGMTDREPVEWFKETLGFGYIYTTTHAGRKDMHRYETAGWDRVEQVCAWFSPYLSPRRLARFEEVLAMRPVLPTSPDCGNPSAAAYRRHLRAGEPPCQPCRRANTGYERARKGDGRKPRYPDGRGYSESRTAGAASVK